MGLFSRALESLRDIEIPTRLYHGSAFKQERLSPGFAHTGEKVEWDYGESNEFLYATTDRDAAIQLGFASAIEKKFKLDRFQCDDSEITITASERITMHDLEKLEVYVYSLPFVISGGWQQNRNPNNHIDTEWKTKKTVDFGSVEKVDMKSFLAGKKISINSHPK
jgi:hypothetical protein